MLQEQVTEHDIFETMRKSVNNSINFENCTEFKEYDYDADESKVGSALGLCYTENYIINTVVPYLKNNGELRSFSEKEVEKYSYRPMTMSFDVYGVIDYWWVILAVNGYKNPNEFHSFTSLIVPTIGEIESILDKEMYANESVGNVPESTDR